MEVTDCKGSNGALPNDNKRVITRLEVYNYMRKEGFSPFSIEYKSKCIEYLSDKVSVEHCELKKAVKAFSSKTKYFHKNHNRLYEAVIRNHKEYFELPFLKSQSPPIKKPRNTPPDPCLPNIPSKANMDVHMNMVIKYFENLGLFSEATILKEVHDYENPININDRLKSLIEQNFTDEKDPFEDVSNSGVDYKIKEENLSFEETVSCQGESIEHFVKVEEIDSIPE